MSAAAGCQLDVERGPDWLLVKVRKYDEDSAGPRLAERLWQLLEQHFTYRLVLELDQVSLLSSTLIGQLVQLYLRISEHEGVLRLCGLSPHNRQVLRTCALADRFPSYNTRHEAILGECDPRRPR